MRFKESYIATFPMPTLSESRAGDLRALSESSDNGGQARHDEEVDDAAITAYQLSSGESSAISRWYSLDRLSVEDDVQV